MLSQGCQLHTQVSPGKSVQQEAFGPSPCLWAETYQLASAPRNPFHAMAVAGTPNLAIAAEGLGEPKAMMKSVLAVFYSLP